MGDLTDRMNAKMDAPPPAGTGSLTGRLPATLANAVSDAMNAAMRRGMEADEAASVVIAVAADYARVTYGNSYLQHLKGVIDHQAAQPLPSST